MHPEYPLTYSLFDFVKNSDFDIVKFNTLIDQYILTVNRLRHYIFLGSITGINRKFRIDNENVRLYTNLALTGKAAFNKDDLILYEGSKKNKLKNPLTHAYARLSRKENKNLSLENVLLNDREKILT